MRERIAELVKLALGPGVIDVRGITVREAGIGLGWGFLVFGLGLLQLFLGVWQCLVGVLFWGYDRIGKLLREKLYYQGKPRRV